MHIIKTLQGVSKAFGASLNQGHQAASQSTHKLSKTPVQAKLRPAGVFRLPKIQLMMAGFDI